MKCELDVLEQLTKVLNDGLDIEVVLDYPDTDNMPHSTMVYVEPENADYEPLTTSSDLAVLHATLYIMAKKEKATELLKKVFRYANSIFSLIRENQTLDGFIDFATITSLIYYPSVDVNTSIKAIELSLDLQWTKDWN